MKMDTILGFVRHVLTFGGGYLASANIIEASQVDVAVGAIITLVGVVWSAIDKKDR